MKPLGLLLCGGQSSRMGTDKWRLTINHQSWLEHGLQVLASHCDKVYISSQKILDLESYDNDDFVLDLYPGQGPLGAWLSFAKKFPTRDLLSLPVDMPLIRSQDMQALIGSSSYLVGQKESAPLAAYLQNQDFHKLADLFDQGMRSVNDFWSEIAHQKIVLPEEEHLINLNSRKDLANIEENQL